MLTDFHTKKWVEVNLLIEVYHLTGKRHSRLRIRRSDGSEDNVEPFLKEDAYPSSRQLTQLVYDITKESLAAFLAPPVPTVEQKAFSASRQAKRLLLAPLRRVLRKGSFST